MLPSWLFYLLMAPACYDDILPIFTLVARNEFGSDKLIDKSADLIGSQIITWEDFHL